MGDTPQMHCNDDTWCGPHPSHPPGTATEAVILYHTYLVTSKAEQAAVRL